MASSFSTDLKLELMVTGENSGTWGDKTNTNLNLLQQSIAGYQSIALTSINTTLLMTDATISDARNAVIEFTGTLSANSTVYIQSGIEKTYTIKNSTTGAYTLALNQVGGSSVIWGTTEKNIKGIYLNGTNANTIDLSTLGGTINSSATLADFVVGSNELDTASVTSFKIASFAVTSAALDTASVTSVKIQAGAVTSVKFAAGAVGPTQLANTLVTAGSYSAATITVDAQGRLTAASAGGAAGAGMEIPTRYTGGPASGTHTASPTANRLGVYLTAGGGAGGGGGCTMCVSYYSGGDGGQGGFGFYNKPITQPFSQPFTIGGGGVCSGGTANAGGATNFTNVGSVNGGNGGARANFPGGPFSAGNQGNAPGASLTYATSKFIIGKNSNVRGVGGGASSSTNGGSGQPGSIVIFENIGT
jgi:hypothetical protein